MKDGFTKRVPGCIPAMLFSLSCGGCGWILGMEKGDIKGGDGGIDLLDVDAETEEVDLADQDIPFDAEVEIPKYCEKDEDCDNGEPCDGRETCSEAGECEAGEPLEEGSSCTLNPVVQGFCQGGRCIPQTCGDGVKDPGEECDDGNEVEDDGCKSDCTFSCHRNDECGDEEVCTTDICETEGDVRRCRNYANHDECDDEDVCTELDRCEAGTCSGGTAISCDDENACTEDGCDPAGGCTHTCTPDQPCNDDDPCTAEGVCVEGIGECECLLGENTCDCSSLPCTTWDDGNPCNGTLVCDDLDHRCKLQMLAMCDDSTDTQCRKNNCVPDPAEAEEYRCEMQDEPEGTPCDDGSVCTLGDACVAGECTPGEELDCDDHNQCTEDSCHPVEGCRHEPTTGTCHDDLFCTVIDTCDGTGECIGTPRPCNDDNECTVDFCNEVDDACQFVAVPDLTPCGEEGEGYCCLEGVCMPCEPGT